MAIRKQIFESREEWLKGRTRIGGSDASAVLGLNPYMTNVDLWELKTGRKTQPDISEKPYVKFGVEAESIVRELFKLNYPQYKVFYEENNLWTNTDFEFAGVSHDGWLIDDKGRNGIWECKTTEIVSSMHKEKWNDQIPQNYYCQILHSFLVRTDCEFAVLTALLTWKREGKEIYQQLKNYHFERSELQEDLEILEEAERKFWLCILDDKKPDLILPTI